MGKLLQELSVSERLILQALSNFEVTVLKSLLHPYMILTGYFLYRNTKIPRSTLLTLSRELENKGYIEFLDRKHLKLTDEGRAYLLRLKLEEKPNIAC